MKKNNWFEKDAAYIWHPYSPLKQFSEVIPIVSGHGATLTTANNQTIIDAIASWWTNLHGHAHPYIATKLYEQALKLEHVIFAGFTHEPAATLSERLIEQVALQQHKVFFSDNGSTAVEVAVKMALQYWYNKDIQKRTIIAFEDAYHGDTFGAMSVSARSLFTKPFDTHLFDVKFISRPMGNGRSIDELKHILTQPGVEDIAAFIYEPLVQGTAGMLMYDKEEMNELLQLINERNILLIADEVFTGFYRTGTMLASHQLRIAPDLICLSKGLTGGFMPLGVTLCNARMAEAYEQVDRSKSFFHGHSYTGNPLACTVANASLDLLLMPETQESILRINKQHRIFQTQLDSYAYAKDPRICGTIAAVDFAPDAQKQHYLNAWRDVIYEFFLQRNVLLRPLGATIYIVPPYCITMEQLEKVHNVIFEWFEWNEHS